ncbi:MULTISPECIES: anhydro-N-acetylmuramic acid kinase [Flavobacterium]|uniref:Anhydro-N-acetylmuramic acid kinase n=1 Tax=Flavobacterium keumense TaxID=1306518 RepID=A0ABY8N325_9FLAO|nr:MULTISPECIES: anhydro-N-acetylmuramic acid kinase [Flavobacterium]WGK94060.1 anhydro-N-acetylmuramic acid kinase [Flavobacterium keumense]
MNTNIESLYRIAQKPTRTIIGLMSGTSLDGLDVALCEISGASKSTVVQLKKFKTIPYSEAIKAEIRKVFAKKTIDFQHLALLNEWIGILHANLVLDCLKEWNIAPAEVDLIASHGQTVMHAPKILHQQVQFPNATLQIGDGDHIAVRTGIITISDFRQKHVAAGGEGAPLAIYGDYYLFGSEKENRIMLNIGGIGNFTFLPKNQNPEHVFVTDTGTGNTLIDAFVKLHFPKMSYDKDAQIARKGTINAELLQALKDNSFFKEPFPKTTGPELFNLDYIQSAMTESQTQHLPVEDVVATLTRFSAETAAEAILYAIQNSEATTDTITVYVSGGGIHNPLLMEYLNDLLPCSFKNTNDLGISADAKEAILFAVLANETVAGGTTHFGTKKGIPSVTMGKISFPN